MIQIVNISSKQTPEIGINLYEIRLNGTTIAEFTHDRIPGGLAQCLRDAAEAVEVANARKQLEWAIKLQELMK